MEQEKFYKFPKTPHIEGSCVVDDDQVLTKGDFKTLVGRKTTLVVQEKVDGANVSVYFNGKLR